MFFFEKKNQKTFAPCGTRLWLVVVLFWWCDAPAAALRCGVVTETDDWGKAEQHGDLSAFDGEICRAVGVSLGRRVEIVRFAVEQAGLAAVRRDDADVVVGVTPSASAAMRNGVRFGAVVFFDAIAVMVRGPGGLAGRSVCASDGSDAEALLSAALGRRGTVFSFQEEGEMESALLGGRCSGVAATVSRLGEIGARYRLGPVAVLPQRLGMVPASVAYRPADVALGAVVDWTVYALLAAEAAGVSRARPWRDDGNLAAERLMGVAGDAGPALGLRADWVAGVVAEVGNYGEIFSRTVGLPRDENALWRDGGLMVPMPVQ